MPKKIKNVIRAVNSIAACLLLGFIQALLPAGSTAAACAAPTANYGSVSSTVSVETAGTYKIWSRIMAPDTINNSYFLEIDGGTCYVVGDNGLAANQWTWVDYQSGNTGSKISLNLSAGNHSLKLIGREPNVKVDRILAVADGSCTTGPTGLGDNCTTEADTIAPAVAITAPAENATVSGTVNAAATATDANGITRVDFLINNVLKSTDTTSPYSYNWDTTTLSNGTHNISVRAYDAAGNIGTDTNTVAVRNGDIQTPGTPTNAKATVNSATKVTLSWTASTDNIGVAGYRISRNGVAVADAGPVTSYVDSSVMPNTSYTYKITAYDAAGNISPASSGVTVTTPQVQDTQAPSTPQNLTATVLGSAQVNLAWTASTDNVAVSGYDVYRVPTGAAAAKIATSTTTSFGDTGLTAGTQYSYYVVARDASGNTSTQSVTVLVTTATQPTTPPPSGGDNPTTPSQSVSVIRGKVTGSRGQALSNARVVAIANGKRYAATTNSKGVYRLENLPSGRYSVHYQAKGYSPGDEVFRLNGVKEIVWNMRLDKN